MPHLVWKQTIPLTVLWGLVLLPLLITQRLETANHTVAHQRRRFSFPCGKTRGTRRTWSVSRPHEEQHRYCDKETSREGSWVDRSHDASSYLEGETIRVRQTTYRGFPSASSSNETSRLGAMKSIKTVSNLRAANITPRSGSITSIIESRNLCLRESGM